MPFTYDYNAVKTEAGFWVIEPQNIERIARVFCPKNGDITLHVPIGDYFCKELTKSGSPNKAINQNKKAPFDTLTIVLPRILGMTTGERFSSNYYNQVLPDDTFELTKFREKLVDYYEYPIETAFQVLVDGITSGKLGDDNFQSHREMFWHYMSRVLWDIYGPKLSESMKWDTENSPEIIEGKLPTMLPIGDYYTHLFPPPKKQHTEPIKGEPPRGIHDVLEEFTTETEDEAKIFKGLFSFLIDFFSGNVNLSGGAERNAQTRAPQNIFILLRRFCPDDPFLTEFDFRTGKSSNLISNAKDFEKLKNQANRFLEQPVNADPKLFKDLLDPNPSNDEKQRGKTRAIYELLFRALDKKKNASPTKAENTEKGRNLQLQNAMKWELRDFKTILQKWLNSIDQETHDLLYELCKHELEDPEYGTDEDERILHPLFRIFEPVELEQAEDWIRKKIKRVRLGKVKRDDLVVFFYCIFRLYERTD